MTEGNMTEAIDMSQTNPENDSNATPVEHYANACLSMNTDNASDTDPNTKDAPQNSFEARKNVSVDVGQVEGVVPLFANSAGPGNQADGRQSESCQPQQLFLENPNCFVEDWNEENYVPLGGVEEGRPVPGNLQTSDLPTTVVLMKDCQPFSNPSETKAYQEVGQGMSNCAHAEEDSNQFKTPNHFNFLGPSEKPGMPIFTRPSVIKSLEEARAASAMRYADTRRDDDMNFASAGEAFEHSMNEDTTGGTVEIMYPPQGDSAFTALDEFNYYQGQNNSPGPTNPGWHETKPPKKRFKSLGPDGDSYVTNMAFKPAEELKSFDPRLPIKERIPAQRPTYGPRRSLYDSPTDDLRVKSARSTRNKSNSRSLSISANKKRRTSSRTRRGRSATAMQDLEQILREAAQEFSSSAPSYRLSRNAASPARNVLSSSNRLASSMADVNNEDDFEPPAVVIRPIKPMPTTLLPTLTAHSHVVERQISHLLSSNMNGEDLIGDSTNVDPEDIFNNYFPHTPGSKGIYNQGIIDL